MQQSEMLAEFQIFSNISTKWRCWKKIEMMTKKERWWRFWEEKIDEPPYSPSLSACLWRCYTLFFGPGSRRFLPTGLVVYTRLLDREPSGRGRATGNMEAFAKVELNRPFLPYASDSHPFIKHATSYLEFTFLRPFKLKRWSQTSDLWSTEHELKLALGRAAKSRYTGWSF